MQFKSKAAIKNEKRRISDEKWEAEQRIRNQQEAEERQVKIDKAENLVEALEAFIFSSCSGPGRKPRNLARSELIEAIADFL